MPNTALVVVELNPATATATVVLHRQVATVDHRPELAELLQAEPAVMEAEAQANRPVVLQVAALLMVVDLLLVAMEQMVELLEMEMDKPLSQLVSSNRKVKSI